MADAAKKAKILQAAQKLVQKGQYDKAIKELLVLVKEEPKDVRIWLKIGDLHAKRGAAADAIETYLRVADFYSEQGFHLKAIAVYRQILSIDGSRIEFNLKLAEIYAHLALVRESFDQYELVATSYLRAGNNAEAIKVLQRMVHVDAENIPNRIRLAEMLSRESRKDEAADEFGAAAARLEAAGRLDDFVKVGERLVYHRPGDTVTLKRLAYLYIERRDPKRALAKLQQAFKIAPNDAETLGFLAQAFRGIGQIPKTIQVLKELCTLLDREGRRADRDEVWRQILELDPRDADAQRALGAGAAAAPAPAPAVPGRAKEGDVFPAAAPREARVGAGWSPRGGDFDIEDDEDERADSGGAQTMHDGGRDVTESSAEMVLDDDLVEEVEDESGAVAAAAAAAWSEPKPDLRKEAPPAAAAAAAALFGRTEPRPGMTGAVPIVNPVALAAAAAAAGMAGYGAGGASAEPNQEIAKILQECDIYIKYGLHSKAIEHVRKVFAHEPNHLGALQRLGDLYIGNGSYEDAVKVLLKLAEAHQGRGERDAAVAVLHRAVEIKPDEREVHARLQTLGKPVFSAGDEDTPVESLLDDEDDERTPVGEVLYRGSVEDDGLAPEALFDDDEVPELLPGRGPAGGARGGRGPDPLGYASDGERSLLDDFSELPVGDDAVDETQTTRRGGRDNSTHDDDQLDANHGSGPILGAGLVPSVPSGTRPARARPLPREATPVGGSTGVLGGEAEIVDALEEADFFVAQGLLDEARAIVDDTRERHPADQRLLKKQLQLAELLVDRTQGHVAKPAARPTPVTDPTSENPLPASGPRQAVAAEVDESIELAQRIAEDVAEELEGFSVAGAAALRPDSVSEALQQTARGQVAGDSATRFDLAIAYKEMGLLDAAVTEFKAVLDSGYKSVDCWQLIGLCLVEKGEFPRAVAAFKSGLAVDGIREHETIGLYYELGAVYEQQNDLREALYYFENVDRRDPKFRGVRSRVAALRARAGGGAAAPAAGASTRTAESGASPLPVSGAVPTGDDEEFELAAQSSSDEGETYH